MVAQVNEPGHLVTIKPGSYLTDITMRRGSAMHFVESPTLGVVLEEETNGMNLVQVNDDLHSRIYARKSALTSATMENDNDK